MYSQHTLVIHLGAWLPYVVVLAILSLAFEIWMIVDAIHNENISDNAKALWVVGMLLIHPIIAIAYFFTDHRKR